MLSGCERGPRQVEFTGTTMGSGYSVKLVVDSAQTLPDSLEQDIFAVLDQVDKTMTTYNDQSELMRLNATPVGTAMALSPPLVQVLTESERIHGITDGLFDPTVGPLVNLWGFGPDFTGDQVPSREQIDALMPRIGFDGLQLDAAASTATRVRDVRLDLSGIAQGFAADRVADHLRNLGITNFLVDVSGDMVAAGHNQRGEPWRVAVEVPADGERQVQRILAVSDKAVTTSGSYRNYFIRDGIRYSHAIDPRSGEPVRHDLASVTVVTDNCTDADALDTALLVMGAERALAFAEERNLAVLLLVKQDDQVVETYSSAFKPYLNEDD